MPIIWTLGHSSKRTQFSYAGSSRVGVVLKQSGSTNVRREVFDAALSVFQGKTVVGGFSMTNPPGGGFGIWLAENSVELNGRKLTSRHASFVAAILVHETSVRSSLRGNAVYLHF